MTAPTSNSSNNASSNTHVASTAVETKDPSEVGLVFAHEYYTFLNKDPSRLHCFYNKISTMSHGVQGEEVHIYQGQQAIRNKFTELDFEDCKVLVSNLDCQASVGNGIVIQVVGELSNRGGPAQKFVQTFFLAEQPQGYYVLNDLFRYLKDDRDEEYEGEDEEEEEEQQQEEVSEKVDTAQNHVDTKVEAVRVLESPHVVEEAALKAQVKEEKLIAVVTVSEDADDKAEKKTEHAKAEAQDATTTDVTKVEAAPSASEVSAPASALTSAPASVPASTPTSAPASTPTTPVPAQSLKPKTWANLAANNSSQWGAQVANGKTGAVAAVPAPTPATTTFSNASGTPAPAPKPASQPQSQPHGQARPHHGHGHKREEYHSIYIKAVTPNMTLAQLRESFSKFGVVTHLELTQKKNCAFLDFSTPEAMRAALKQNQVPVGNEIVLAEERRRGGGGGGAGGNNAGFNSNFNGNQGGRSFNNQQQHSVGPNGHQQGGGGRGGRGNSNNNNNANARKPTQGAKAGSAPTYNHDSNMDKGKNKNSHHHEEVEGHQEEEQEQEYDRYKDNPDLLGEFKSTSTRLFSFDWASGFVSPFRPTPQDILARLFDHVQFSRSGSDTLLDLGCGDGLVLIQALKTFPPSQLRRTIGVDLDLPLLETSKTKIQEDTQHDIDDDDDSMPILSRLELYHGDLTANDEPLFPILTPPSRAGDNSRQCMRRLVQESSHLFVYLLPEALSKLSLLLLEAIQIHHKVVLSMRWEIPDLRPYLVYGGEDQQFYIYQQPS
ncbi:hypothetical protein EDD11_007084 [Mortierella claussenii]|nr:hypothetical protein EDD11_007084 [Mortierella claussenii]